MPINVKDQLATSLGKNDEAPNIALATKIVKSDDKLAVKELVSLLNDKKTAVRSDVIKVLYEIAGHKVEMVLPYTTNILALLDHKDNRMKWGAMTTLSAISKEKPELIAKHLPAILEAMDTGTVITRDHGIIILCQTAKLKKHHNDSIELLLEQLERSPVNQVPSYAEQIFEVLSSAYIKRFESILKSRTDVADFSSKQKRIEKLLKKTVSFH
ncbi:MAG TPA: hypothetical protein VMZ69_09000 [Saprospiraceae bacterium]|nr:hypothetical protein [Saprospiraceae bacterium]